MENNFDELLIEVEQYMEASDVDDVQKAYYFARNAHEGQTRKSGEPFIMHPVSVALVLANLKLPSAVIISALLHDVVEDTEYTYDNVKDLFGEEVANIVQGVTKLGAIQGLSNDFVRAENHRKIILSAARDIRVILVKLADRLHNMQTIKYMNSSKQKLIANETLEVYAPIAHRLGMYQIKWELEDLSFKCINSDAYDEIAKKLNMKRSEREDVVTKIVNDTNEYLESKNLEVKILGRSKHIYSIYQKISKQQKDFDELTDLFAFRVIVNSISECYTVLGLLHEKYKPIPMKFKDYIPTPKHNMYQSIHTTVLSDSGFPIEFQIRTHEMDLTAEYGIASHWMYKENTQSNEVQSQVQDQIYWLKQALELDTDIDPRKFMDQVKLDYFSKNLIVYTPKGDVVEIPEGSTVLDFAYYIHTTVGNTAVSAKVNDRVVSLFYKLSIGDIVQIITNDSAQPSVSYIQKVKTNRARESLRQYFKDAEKRQIQVEGRKLLIKYAVDNNIFDIKDTLENNFEDLVNKFNAEDLSDFYYLIGSGVLDLHDIIIYLKNEKIAVTYKSDVIINNDPELTKYRFCSYCSPIAGDEIVATLDDTHRNGLNSYVIHRKDMEENGLEAKFTPLATHTKYVARLKLEILDQPESISHVMSKIGELKLNITSIFFRAAIGSTAYGRISIEISNIEALEIVMNKLQELDNVLSVERITE